MTYVFMLQVTKECGLIVTILYISRIDMLKYVLFLNDTVFQCQDKGFVSTFLQCFNLSDLFHIFGNKVWFPIMLEFDGKVLWIDLQ